jgi:hypothetical protein
MELLTPPSAVLLSRLVQPVIFYQHRIFWLETEAGGFLAGQPPVVLDASGEPIVMAAEIPVGSVARAHVVDGDLRTVQITQRKVVNPFAMAA